MRQLLPARPIKPSFCDIGVGGGGDITTEKELRQKQGSDISYLVPGGYDKQQCTYISQVHIQQGLALPWELT